MTTYVVVDNEVHNREEYQKYLELITPTVDRYNGKYVIRAGKILFSDTEWRPDRLVVIEFANKEDALQWVTSEEVNPIHEMRRTNATSKLIVIEGFEEHEFVR